MANAADIIVNLVAKTGRFERGMTQGRKKLTKFQAQVKKTALAVANLAKRFGPLAAAAVLTGFIALTKAAIDANDKLGKMATTLGIATERLRGLQLAAELAGVEQNAFNKGIVKLGKAVVDAANGLTTYLRIFQRLNITTEELLNLSPDEQLIRIGQALAGIESSTERAAIAYDLFGGRNVQLVNLLTQSAESIEAVIQKAQDLGAALTGFDVARFEAAQDELTLIKTSFEGIRNTLTIDVLPGIGIMSELIQGVAKDAKEVTVETDTWVFNLVRSVGAVVSMGKAMINVGRIIVAIGLGILNFLLKPVEIVEATMRRIINLGGLLDVVPANTFTEAFIARAEEFRVSLDKQVLASKGLVGEMDVIVQGWLDAKTRSEEAAAVIQKQREDLRKTSAGLIEFIRQKAEADAAEKKALAERTARQKELNAILTAGQAKSLGIAQKIAVLSAALVSGEFIANERERNVILARSVELQLEFVEAQQQEQGIETAADRAKLLVSILQRAEKETVRVAKQIASINTAILKGEGDRNQQFEARKILIEQLIQLQKDEQTQVGRLTEVGLQALRNMQDSLADFFATTRGGFRGLISGFTDMLRKMVAQLLARRILLSFLGLFAGGSGSLAQFAQRAISGLQKGGPLNVGQEALVGEERPEVFIPKNVLSFPTLSRLPKAVAEDVEKRHDEGSLPVDQIRVIGRRGPELFKATESGTVVPMAMFSRNVLADIERRQSGGPLAAGQLSLVGEEGAELFIPKRAGQIIPTGGFGNITVTIEQRNTFTGTGPLEPAVLIPLLEENNRKLKAEFVDELRRGTFS